LQRLLDDGMVVPRPLGVDGDRESLQFIGGDVPTEPYPAYVWSDDSLIAGAQLLRRIHDVVEDVATADLVWRDVREPRETVCHNDFTPYNTLFRDGLVVGVIDFDTASPGPRIRDIAYSAYRWVPLQAPTHGTGPKDESERERRLALFLGAYGSTLSPTDVRRVALTRVRELRAHTAERAIAYPHVASHVALYDADIAYLEEQL